MSSSSNSVEPSPQTPEIKFPVGTSLVCTYYGGRQWRGAVVDSDGVQNRLNFPRFRIINSVGGNRIGSCLVGSYTVSPTHYSYASLLRWGIRDEEKRKNCEFHVFAVTRTQGEFGRTLEG